MAQEIGKVVGSGEDSRGPYDIAYGTDSAGDEGVWHIYKHLDGSPDSDVFINKNDISPDNQVYASGSGSAVGAPSNGSGGAVAPAGDATPPAPAPQPPNPTPPAGNVNPADSPSGSVGVTGQAGQSFNQTSSVTQTDSQSINGVQIPGSGGTSTDTSTIYSSQSETVNGQQVSGSSTGNAADAAAAEAQVSQELSGLFGGSGVLGAAAGAAAADGGSTPTVPDGSTPATPAATAALGGGTTAIPNEAGILSGVDSLLGSLPGLSSGSATDYQPITAPASPASPDTPSVPSGGDSGGTIAADVNAAITGATPAAALTPGTAAPSTPITGGLPDVSTNPDGSTQINAGPISIAAHNDGTMQIAAGPLNIAANSNGSVQMTEGAFSINTSAGFPSGSSYSLPGAAATASDPGAVVTGTFNPVQDLVSKVEAGAGWGSNADVPPDPSNSALDIDRRHLPNPLDSDGNNANTTPASH